MIVAAKQTRRRLRKKWSIDDVWTFDPANYLLPFSVMERLSMDLAKDMPEYVPEIFDCENFAFDFVTQMRQFQSLHIKCKDYKTKQHPWGVGVAAGTKFNGIKTKHSINILMCQEGDFWFDLRSRKIFEPRPSDNPFFIQFF